MNIYLDIDGVIITKDGKPANHSKEFLKYITANHEVYWLTTHCKGDASYTFNYISRDFPKDIHPYLKKIKATNWQTNKTEAIDFTKSFIWLDDYIFESEKKVLNIFSNNWVEINLKTNPDQLEELLDEFDPFNRRNVSKEMKRELITQLELLSQRTNLVEWVQKDLRVGFARWIYILRQIDMLGILDPELSKGSLLQRKINRQKLNNFVKDHKVRKNMLTWKVLNNFKS